MAGELAQFFVRLGTLFDDKGFKEAAAAVKGVETRVDALSGVIGQLGAAVGAGSAIYGIVSFAKSSVDAFAEQERAARRLQGAMQNLGSYSEAAFRDQLAFSQEMQRASTYTDEDVLSVQTLLTTYGLYGDKLKQTTQAVMDLATRKGLDLHTATVMLGKAFDGETGRLAQLGIHFVDTGSKARNFEQIMSEVQRVAGGAAAQELETYSGRVKSLSVRFGELKESIGRELLPVAELYLGWLQRTATAVEAVMSAAAGEKSGRELTIAAMSREIGEREKNIMFLKQNEAIIPKVAEKLVAEKEKLIDLTVARDREIAALKSEHALKAAAAGPAPAPPGRNDLTEGEANKRLKARQELTEIQNIEDEKYRIRVDAAQMTARDVENFDAMSKSNLLAMEGKFDASRQVLDKQASKNRARSQVDMMSSWGAALSNLTALSNAKTKEVAIVGRIASAAMAIIYGLMGGMLALATIPPPFGWPMAALIKAAGFANAAMIMGVPLARGALVRATSGGVQATVGEGASDEAVLPLNYETLSRLANAIVSAASGGASAFAGNIIAASPQAPAMAGIGGSVQFTQVNHFGDVGGQGSGGAGVQELVENIRIATRDGMAEALDMAKQIVRTGNALDREA